MLYRDLDSGIGFRFLECIFSSAVALSMHAYCYYSYYSLDDIMFDPIMPAHLSSSGPGLRLEEESFLPFPTSLSTYLQKQDEKMSVIKKARDDDKNKLVRKSHLFLVFG